MKVGSAVFVLLVASVTPSLGQHGGTPIPPGVREADKIESRHPLEPPMEVARRSVTPAELERESAELNQLAGSVQREIGMVNQGQFPKDLPKNLKEIEKLAHKMNQQLTR